LRSAAAAYEITDEVAEGAVNSGYSLRRLEIFIDGLNRGGAELVVLDMLPAFVASFDSVEVITLRGTYELDARFAALVPVTKVSLLGMLRRLWSGRGICYVNLARSQTLASIVATTRRRKSRGRQPRVICHEHASFDYYTGRGGLVRVADAVYRSATTHCVRRGLYDYVVLTRPRLAEVANFGGDLSSVILLPNSVPALRMASLLACRAERVTANLRPESTRFFTFSRLHAVKQIEWAIDAVAELAINSSEDRFVLTIYGRGSERQSLENHAMRYARVTNLRIEFAGFVASLEVAASQADFFLLPSKNEGFAVALVEAALTGIPSIANNCPHGPADLAQHFENIYLASPPSHEVFVRTVRDVVARKSRRSSRPREVGLWPTSEELAKQLIAFMLRENG
jgi:glycosyltransferase involved in cell wall biosynthesis